MTRILTLIAALTLAAPTYASLGDDDADFDGPDYVIALISQPVTGPLLVDGSISLASSGGCILPITQLVASHVDPENTVVLACAKP
jgi:hypothetical protein